MYVYKLYLRCWGNFYKTGIANMRYKVSPLKFCLYGCALFERVIAFFLVYVLTVFGAVLFIVLRELSIFKGSDIGIHIYIYIT